MTPFIVKEGTGTLRGLPTDVKFTINCAKLILVLVTHMLAFQISPRICGGVGLQVVSCLNYGE